MRALIYARFSTDKQRETSIEDQARVCRARADQLAIADVATLGDDGISGSVPVDRRPAGRQLLAEVEAKRVDVLLIESLDRLSRDVLEQETIIRLLEHCGVRIIGVSDGYDTEREGRELQRGIMGAVNQQYLRDLGKKVHRGLAGQLARGYHAGGISYGYRSVVAGYDAKGEPIGHHLQVHEDQAAIVRRIFTRFAAGESCQRIAHALNADRVPGPRSATWGVSVLFGSPAKGSGILNNELYIGRYVWNRSQWRTSPITKKRVRIQRPREEWVIEERPELRLVDDATWQAVRDRLGKRPGKGGRPAQTLLGGLLRCGKCGGAMIAVDVNRYGCAAAKDRGPTVCTGIVVRRKDAEALILADARGALFSPAIVSAVRLKVQRRLAGKKAAAATTRADQLERQVRNLSAAIAEIGISPSLRSRLTTAEAELQLLRRDLLPVRQAVDVDAAMAQYKRLAMEFTDALGKSPDRARAILAHLGPIRIEEEGDQAFALMPTAERLLVAVAGGGASNSGCGGRI